MSGVTAKDVGTMSEDISSGSSGTDTQVIKTTRFGELTIQTDKIITMTTAFLGFPDSFLFTLHPHGPESPFMWFQSLNDPALAFVVMQPAAFDPQYQPEIGAHIKEELRISDDKDMELLVILTIPRNNPREMTANLLGPVIFNVRERLGKQIVLDPKQYECCRPVFHNQGDGE